mmetsp:Transcript_5273/g.4862  ORF Transcript_5273/g.4862 Transcript_5273/m.4862 type:complete len:177 (-) Transcript_5273:22-552(-)
MMEVPISAQRQASIKKIFNLDKIPKQKLNNQIDFNFLRLWALVDFEGSIEEFEALLEDIKKQKKEDLLPRTLHFDQEKVVLASLIATFRNRLDQYPSTIQQDQDLLRTNLSSNERNCILVRLGEKIVLTTYLDFAEFALSFIEMEEHSKILGRLLQERPLYQQHAEYFHKIQKMLC